jgi:hypothetical protein
MSWASFEADHGALLFEGAEPGEVIQLVLERDGQHVSIPWIYAGATASQVFRYVLSGFWLGYFFWLAGILTALHLRPTGEAWKLASCSTIQWGKHV